MTRKRNKRQWPAAVLSLAITGLLMVGGVHGWHIFQWSEVARALVWPLTRLMGYILIGLAAGQAIESLGWTRSLAFVARPLFRFSRLGEACAATFITAFVSGVAANAMLMEFHQEGKISRTQLFLTNFMNQLPAFFLHLPTTFFIVVPLTRTAGLLYFLLTFLAAVLRTVVLAVYGHLYLPPTAPLKPAAARTSLFPAKAAQGVWAVIRAKLPRRLLNIAIYVIPIYVAVFLINRLGLFDLARDWLAHFVVTAVVPVESLSVVVLSFVAEFTSGFAAAGAMLEAGMLTVKQTVIALLLGNILAFPMRALRHQLPHYMGIFSPGTGATLLLAGQALRIVSLVLIGVCYYLIA
jgi:hypothetical protein